jgi:hypothetical protein
MIKRKGGGLQQIHHGLQRTGARLTTALMRELLTVDRNKPAQQAPDASWIFLGTRDVVLVVMGNKGREWTKIKNQLNIHEAVL